MIKQLEEILIEFIDNLPELFILADASDWTILALNKSMAQSLGKTKEELIGKKVPDFFQPDVLKIRKKYAEKAIRTGKPVFFIDKRNRRWFKNAFYPLFFPQKKVFVGAFVQDITSQKKAEKTGIESEEKFKNLAEQSPNMIYINKMGRIVYANKICGKIMGYSREEFYSHDFNFLNLIAPEYKDKVKKSFKEHIAGKDLPSIEYALITKKGKRIEAIHTTKLIQYEGKPAILGIVTDITNQKKTEEDIRKIRDYLQNIIDSSSELVFVLDNDLKISTWNKTAELITGYKKREVIGKSIKSLDLFDDLNSIFMCFENHKMNRTGISNELIIKTKTGEKKLLQLTCSNLESQTEEIEGILFMGKDITKESEAQGKLIPGNSYIITDKTNDAAINLLKDLAMSRYNGLFITRGLPEDINNNIRSLEKVEAIILSQQKINSFKNIEDLNDLAKKIESFSVKKPKSIILLDRIDYLISNYTFEAVIKELYKITNVISKNKGILLVRINPIITTVSQLAILEEELSPLPSQKLDTIELDDYLFDILTFIDEQNQHNIIVSFKKISKKSSISKVTTSKRLGILEQKGLILIKKQGKLKTLHISEKGKMLLHKRKII